MAPHSLALHPCRKKSQRLTFLCILGTELVSLDSSLTSSTKAFPHNAPALLSPQAWPKETWEAAPLTTPQLAQLLSANTSMPPPPPRALFPKLTAPSEASNPEPVNPEETLQHKQAHKPTYTQPREGNTISHKEIRGEAPNTIRGLHFNGFYEYLLICPEGPWPLARRGPPPAQSPASCSRTSAASPSCGLGLRGALNRKSED